MGALVDHPWSRPAEDVLAALGVRADEGLSEEEAARRLAEHGRNRLEEARPVSAWSILVRQLSNLVTALLTAAAVAAFFYREWAEGIAVIVVIFLNAGIGFFTELRAVRSMEALRRLGTAATRVRRGGRVREVPADELVPGDVVLVEAGDLMAADLRLLTASRLQANESQLTGESLPVDKGVEPMGEETPLAERAALLFRGSAAVRGSGEGVVVATGMATEVGRIASLVATSRGEATPLEKRLDRLSRNLAWVAIVIAAVTAGGGALAGRPLFLMIETGIALAVAAIPEGLPIVATLALARGVFRMAKRNALVNRLSAVETLGAVTLICTDKTGTLTENRMTVTRIVVEDGEFEPEAANPVVRTALEVGVLCNNAALAEDGSGVGDPMEVALLEAAERAGLDRGRLLAEEPEAWEEAFDSVRKMMATFHRRGEGFRVAVKGAPEAVLAVCSRVLAREGEREMSEEDRRQWLEREEALAGQGYRILGLAQRPAASVDEGPYAGLVWIGLAALEDPPREEVRDAVAEVRRAGIDIVMVTGDQAPTALTIARAVGVIDEGDDPQALSGRDLADQPWSEEERRRLRSVRIFSRVDPEQKLDLIALHQETGQVVAMTGDGVNDAPALKKADIGIAMGRRGSQVAREAADVVLKDDSFATIAVAVRQGRVIFGNIRRFVLFLLSCNASEVLVVATAALIGAPLPLLPLQLLFLNLVTDVFPALALGLGEGDPRVMDRPPRDPKEPLIARRHAWAIVGYAVAMTAAVLGALFWSLGRLGGERRAVTIAFLTLAFAQLWHVFNMRRRGSGLLVNEITTNRWVWGAIGLCAAMLVLAVYVPPLAAVLDLADPGPRGWLVVAVMSLVPLVLGQIALVGTARTARTARTTRTTENPPSL